MSEHPAKFQRDMSRGDRLLIGPHVVVEVSRAVRLTVFTGEGAADSRIVVVPSKSDNVR